jgi:L-rhamnose mutarotase
MKQSALPVYGPTNPTPEERQAAPVKRFASMIELRPEKEQYYRELHARVWPSVLARLKKSNIRNYSIYVAQIGDKRYLFSSFEYVGADYAADRQAMADDPETQRWWKETDPCQIPLSPGAKWSELEMVFLME